MNVPIDHDRESVAYERGRTDRQITQLTNDVAELKDSVRLLNRALWMLTGIIAGIQFILPLADKI
jgi:hypothetical protein